MRPSMTDNFMVEGIEQYKVIRLLAQRFLKEK